MPIWAELLQTKTGQIGLLITSYKRLKKTDRAITPAAEVVRVLAHLAPRGYPHAKQLCYLHAQLSLGQSCHRQKSLPSMHAGSLRLCLALCDLVDCGLPGFSVREGVLQARILEHITNTGCHTLLEHYISSCPSCQLP